MNSISSQGKPVPLWQILDEPNIQSHAAQYILISESDWCSVRRSAYDTVSHNNI